MRTPFAVDDGYIHGLLREAQNVSDTEYNDILDRAGRFEGLSHKDVAALLCVSDPVHIERIFRTAGAIKEHIYGQRVVMFAPLYVSDYCINRCAYCGFQSGHGFERRRLTMDEVRQEVRLLEKQGHKRLALEAGEDPANCPLSYILECIKTIYDMKCDRGEIRRVNVNIAATTVEEYRQLKQAGIGTYILFQETYHRPTYEAVHLSGPKSDYIHHLTAFDRAMEAGIDDVGGGVLFGLYDPRFEVIALMLHNEHLDNTFGAGFHTVSMPRLRPAEGAAQSDFSHTVDDTLFPQLAAILRLAIPYTGMIISTRETAAMRKKLIDLGISQVSGGSAVEVGGYAARASAGHQFSVADERNTGEIISWLMEEGLVPSFCTACYRQGRTGDRFMQLAKSGQIKNVCLPNALMTLKEYALDYGDEPFRQLTETLIAKKLPDIIDDKARALTEEKLTLLTAGQRDLYF